ncbi:MAG: hypothetical protein US50_C0014G0006 [Candidatus Nomurabacteria bacterium GW2011_GWB1_37_5]|uniref:Transposase IS200-like domain-containing protein n=1 Tax=Candidatus Nomurabacteria bacterium GW2011_GWB1_37_5 TaxID=1618742 RepID=A0A0G0JFC1_9BACT|nr:MAG: hypothetical protein US50_C0014G0006 [Candidatus Nomurabacteria bacterium GW2011_GWB1_37_5]
MLRKTPLIKGNWYHIYTRGVEKRKIFLDKKDYFRFVAMLYLANSSKNFHLSKLFQKFIGKKKKNQGESLMKKLFSIDRKSTIVSITAYCLMPNHFHLLIYEKEEGGISRFMSKLLTAYSMHFNKKYERSGPLFVRPFRSKHIDEDNYFRVLLSYIHLNPISLINPNWKEEGIMNNDLNKNFLLNYQYSSYPEYMDMPRLEKSILSIDKNFKYFKTFKEFDDFLNNFLRRFNNNDFKDLIQ